MSAPNRIYLVMNNMTGNSVLVEAHHPAAAIKTVASDMFSVSVPTALQVAVMVRDGVALYRAPSEAQAEPAEAVPA